MWKQSSLSKRKFSLLSKMAQAMAYNDVNLSMFSIQLQKHGFQPIKAHVFKMLFYKIIKRSMVCKYIYSLMIYNYTCRNIVRNRWFLCNYINTSLILLYKRPNFQLTNERKMFETTPALSIKQPQACIRMQTTNPKAIYLSNNFR